MNRRDFQFQFGAAVLGGAWPTAFAQQPPRGDEDWRALEHRCGGRLGVVVLRPDGSLAAHRGDERFPMCSTFKWVAAALALQRVDRGQERLDRRVRFGRETLIAHSPVAEKHVGDGMTIAELCDAAITQSDNAAANLLLDSFGGPPAVTRFARKLGDPVTRLDRREPHLNEGKPGDPRDTTSPAAMARLLRAALTGDALSAGSRERLGAWMAATQTNANRLRADLPPGWRMGSKTGTGGRGSTNDVGFFYPPGSAQPIFVAVYVAESKAAPAQREAVIAEVARRITRRGE